MKGFTALALGIFFSVSLSAQPRPKSEYERLLIPVWTAGLIMPGAFGSMWTTQLVLRNTSDEFVEIFPNYDDYYCLSPLTVECAPGRATPPRTTLSSPGDLEFNISRFGDGVFAWVERSKADAITAQLLTLDVSRSNLSAGTQVPILREHDWFRRPFEIVGIPAAPGFRILLRVFAFPEYDGFRPAVAVRAFDQDSDRLLGEWLASFTASPNHNLAPVAMVPIAVTADVRNVRVEIAPLSGGSGQTELLESVTDSSSVRFWGFATVTHNDTQHVTIFTP